MPHSLDPAIQDFIRQDVLNRFLAYVKIWTTSDPDSKETPSTARQFDLLRLLESQCRELGLKDVHLAPSGTLYATLPASPGCERAEAFGLVSHVDTSPDQSGENVRPVCHENWQGEPIRFSADEALRLAVEDCPELAMFRGDTIITSSGDTLLGADDKAGVAEIMCAAATFQRFPKLPHGELRLCFTTDEEVSRGTEGVDLDRLPTACYTMDGGLMGELENECFDAWQLRATFRGVAVHPGSAKGLMVHAGMAAARLLAALPEAECPERTAGREGFYYLVHLDAGHEEASLVLLLRDFEPELNAARRRFIEDWVSAARRAEPRLQVTLDWQHQYQNMREKLAQHPHITERAATAIADAGVTLIAKEIRGGTDGSNLTAAGHPTPNIFTGGMLYHSRREWVPLKALCKASEVIVHLARRWTEVEGRPA
ncbi:MAG: peptidase T [Calditrichaeota bacterium]|nr:peptidase T [Calditrichota bacterium]